MMFRTLPRRPRPPLLLAMLGLAAASGCNDAASSRSAEQLAPASSSQPPALPPSAAPQPDPALSATPPTSHDAKGGTAGADPPADAGTPLGGFFDGTVAKDAVTKLKEQSSGPLRILKLVIKRDSVLLDAQDPGAMDRLVHYEYRAGQLRPTSTEAIDQHKGRKERERQLFPYESLRLEATPSLVTRAIEATKDREAVVTHMVLERALPPATELRWRLFVRGPITRGWVDASADGHIRDVRVR